jgi:hypothetical protein
MKKTDEGLRPGNETQDFQLETFDSWYTITSFFLYLLQYLGGRGKASSKLLYSQDVGSEDETIQVASDATRKIPRCALVCAAINAAAHLFMGTSMTGFCCARAGGRKGTHSRFSRIGSSEMTNVSVFIAQDIQHVRPRQLLQAHGARQHAAD